MPPSLCAKCAFILECWLGLRVRPKLRWRRKFTTGGLPAAAGAAKPYGLLEDDTIAWPAIAHRTGTFLMRSVTLRLSHRREGACCGNRGGPLTVEPDRRGRSGEPRPQTQRSWMSLQAQQG